MATFHFELASPAKLVFSGEVEQVDVPGSEGDFGVFPGHAPLVTMLKPGMLTVYSGGQKEHIVVLGGFAEVGPNGLTVLADMASSVEDLDRTALEAQITALEENLPEGPARDRATRRLDQLKSVLAALGSSQSH